MSNRVVESVTFLSAGWLRQRFSDGHSAVSRGRMGYEFDQPAPPLISAAVLVPLIERETGMTVLLTKRTEHLRDHAGQISFPGGRCEASDASPVMAALREAREEVGLEPGQVDVLGLLPDYCTGTGFAVTPVVAIVAPPLNLKLDDFEVADVFEVPLEFLLDAGNHQRHEAEFRGKVREYYAMPWNGYYIWGATAGILVNLRRFLLARDEYDSASPVVS